MGHDLFDRLRWTLRLGEPGPVERAAIAIAAQELEEAGVDLPLWQQAEAGARDGVQARQRYIRLRVADLRRELRRGSKPLLGADRHDRDFKSAELARQAAAYRATPEGERAYQAALAVAARGVWVFSALYFAAVLLILLLGLWLGSCMHG